MKRAAFLIFILLVPGAAVAHTNPMFGKSDQNSLTLYAAQGTGPGTLFKLVAPWMWDFEPMTLWMIQYSQPLTIFRLPARMSLHFASNIGYESDDSLSFSALGISWDVSLFDWRGFYIGLGLGPYMRDRGDDRIDSRLVFGEKFFIGYALSDSWRMEVFTLHFSTGDFSDQNNGFNYTGLSIGYSF